MRNVHDEVARHLRRRSRRLVLAALLTATSARVTSAGAAAPAGIASGAAHLVRDLRCEHATDPLGVDLRRPRLSFRIESPRRGARQSAYQILAASSAEALARDRGDLWDTGRVASEQSVLIEYAGAPLASRQRVYWKARSWDGEGRVSPYSAPASFELGLLEPSDWSAAWIGYPPGWSGRARFLRRAFKVSKPVRQARAYVSGLGYYELRLNGAKVGDHVLDPAWTDTSRRVLYATHDVTALLVPGDNVVGAIVGHGWTGAPKLLLQLEITYTDGSTERVATQGGQPRQGGSWRATAGPLLSDSVFDGEVYDARLERPGWDRPGKEPGPRAPAGATAGAADGPPQAAPDARVLGWSTAMPVDPPGGVLESQTLEPIKVVETRTPVRMTEPRPGLYVFDTGQNLAGWAALRVRGPAGTRVELRFAESLLPDGMVNQANLRKAAATDVYILSGQGEDDGHERWEPRFTYHGFRYVEVRGFPGRPGPDALRIRVVRSAVEPNGTFASSHELLNRIDRMVRATEASNLHGVPTDCPQRDERMGWMNDLTVRIEQALFNFRLPRFYAKFLRDVADTQAADGSITDTAPFKWGRRPADPVSVSYLLLAWEVYQHYGDVRPMAEHFAGFARWVDFVAGTAKDGVVPWGSWGDWSPPAAFAQAGSAGAGAISAQTPLPLMSTGYLAYSAELLARMASVLSKPAERRRYEQLAKQTAAAFDRAFWNAERGGYGQSNQSANAFALALGLAPEARRPQILASLLGNVRDANDHLTTGNLCTKYLLDALSDGGHADAAARIATQRTYPSWGFMLDNGATTLWERWEHLTGGQMNSHNHPMMGSVGAWLFTALGGLRPDPAGPGWSRFFVRPKVVPSVTWVRVTHASPYGKIASAWRVAGGALALQVTVPPNSAATIAIPGRAGDITEGGQPAARAAGVRFLGNESGAALFEVGAGSYSFVSRGFAGGGGGR